MTDERERMNPFGIPGAGGPKVPLRPWQHDDHGQYYVPVGNTSAAFDEFTHRMGTLDTLQREGQLVLVAGESGCGKTALINKCAWYVRAKLDKAGTTGVVVPLQSSLVGTPIASGDQRFAYVLQQLLAGLDGEGALRQDADDTIKRYEGQPEALYRQMHVLLKQKHVAIVLLPPSDLPDDVVRYGALSKRNVLFLTEFVYGSHPEAIVDDIETKLEKDAPPIILRLTGLKTGDAPLYIQDRLKRHMRTGQYPLMSPETMAELDSMLQSVAHMQSTCYEVYEQRRKNGQAYDESASVDLKEIAKVMVEMVMRRGKA